MKINNHACYGVNVMDFGAKGDGIADDGPSFQAALDSGEEYIVVPSGIFSIGQTLYINSNTRINAHNQAHIRLASGVCKDPHHFLLTNKHHDTGDCNIIIKGGIWDYNCPGNPRKPDLFDLSGPSGTMLEFRKVKNLILSGMTLSDPECYYTRFCEVEDFLVEDIVFNSRNIRPNQDGVHFCGYCKNGIIRNLNASPESPNDDFIAMNADDCLTRLQNVNTICGPIENIVVENIYAQNCHCFVRMASFVSPIRNIDISNIRGGCKGFVLNMDAARYCRTPLFKNDEYPEGVGAVENVCISNVSAFLTRPGTRFFCLETNVRNFRIRNFNYDFANTLDSRVPAVLINNLGKTEVSLWGISKTAARESTAAGSCKNAAMISAADPHRPDSMVLHAFLNPGESLAIPPGNFDELRLDRTFC